MWEIADKLLQLKRDVHTSFFAAQTMQQKIRHCFHELPQDTHQVNCGIIDVPFPVSHPGLAISSFTPWVGHFQFHTLGWPEGCRYSLV